MTRASDGLLARQLKAIRGRSGGCLITVLDSDTLSVRERREQLGPEFEHQRIPPAQSDDRLVVFVLRRNLEAWLAVSEGKEVTERDINPKLAREGDCARHAYELVRMCTKEQRLWELAVPSLHEACEKYPRLTTIRR